MKLHIEPDQTYWEKKHRIFHEPLYRESGGLRLFIVFRLVKE